MAETHFVTALVGATHFRTGMKLENTLNLGISEVTIVHERNRRFCLDQIVLQI
jgi:hypothetical protein